MAGSSRNHGQPCPYLFTRARVLPHFSTGVRRVLWAERGILDEQGEKEETRASEEACERQGVA